MSLSGSNSSEESFIEHLLYKLVLLGGEAVGKTSIVNKLLQRSIDQTYTPTVGAEFYKAELQITDGIYATLQVWDIGSHVSSLSMAANYLHGCDAVLAVYDATRHETYLQACQWLDLLQQLYQEAALPYIAVIANKVDDEPMLQAAARQLQAATIGLQQAYGYHLSAQTGTNLADTFLRIAADLAGIPQTQEQVDAATNIHAIAHISSSCGSEQLRRQFVQAGSCCAESADMPICDRKEPECGPECAALHKGAVNVDCMTRSVQITDSSVFQHEDSHRQANRSSREDNHSTGCTPKILWPLAPGAGRCCTGSSRSCCFRANCVKYP